MLTSKYQKVLFFLNVFLKNRQNKARQMKDKIKEERHVNYASVIQFPFFRSYKLTKHT